MRVIPEELKESLIIILEWHLKEYPLMPLPFGESSIRLNRLLDNLYCRRYELDESTLYFLKEAIYDAHTNANMCGIEEDVIQKIDTWIKST